MPESNSPFLQSIVQRRKPPGLLLFDAKGKLLSSNSVAWEIIHNRKNHWQVIQKIRKALRKVNHTHVNSTSSVNAPADPLVQATFSSEQCVYGVRAFLLDRQRNGRPPLLAVLLEQINPSRLDLRQAQELFRLSPREIETIQVLQHGMTDKEIASALDISHETARTYVKSIRVKLGVSTRTAIVHKLLSV